MIDEIKINGGNTYRKRQGPFGPAEALLPKNQELLVLEGSTPISDAIERLIDNNFSHIPVTDPSGKIIGVFTWQSFGKRVVDLQSTNINLTQLPIREAMERPKFLGPETYIDTETDWGEIDYVLVGTEENLVGILCISDALGRLNDFAEAFVLIYEIEHEIRDMIRDVYTEEELNEAIETMLESENRQANQVVDELKQVMDQQGNIPAVGKAIKQLRTGYSRSVKKLEDFTFSQYSKLIFSQSNWPRFEPAFDTRQDLLRADFSSINNLRNIVFHFRRNITPIDTDRLRRFRDRLRHDRDIYQRKTRQPAAITTSL